MFRKDSKLYWAACLVALISCLASVASADQEESPHFIVVDGDTLVLAAPLEVVGRVVPVALPGGVRFLDLLSSDELADLPARSTAEQLQMVPGVTVGQRGAGGVQSDLSLRGSTFEQVQLLLDGFDLGDPQTGHHLMNLPVGQQDVQRLEVLPGHGSLLYGANSFGGTVNVVTREPADHNGSRLAVTGGGQGNWGWQGAGDLVASANNGARYSVEHRRTDGPARGLDADTWTGTARLVHRFAEGQTDIWAGYADRQFGALGYYAPYPSWEETRTVFAATRMNRSLGPRLTIGPEIHFRSNRDHFVLLRDDPLAYANFHFTRKVGGSLRALVDLGRRNTLALGLEGNYEDIDSRGLRAGQGVEALGYHRRRRVSAVMELENNLGPALWQMGGRLDARDGYQPRFSSSGALGFLLNEDLTVRGSVGSVHRIPNFTELYYRSPSDQGNPALEPENGWSWDLGLEGNHGPWHGQVAWFQRREHQLIEWARLAGTDAPWLAMNIAEGRVRGAESKLAWWHGAGHVLSLGYTWLEKETTLGGQREGKYSLVTPRHQILLQGTAVLPRGLGLTLTGRYLQRVAGPDHFRVLFVLSGRLDWTTEQGWFAGLTATNLLNRTYEEIPGVPLSGRLLTLTVGRQL